MEGPRGALSENIAFLAQFANQGRALSDPVINLQPLSNRSERGNTTLQRTLTFNEERRLAESFALVLATNDRASQVGAVCIEEQLCGIGFIVRVAMNSGSLEAKKQLFYRMINAARLDRQSGIYSSRFLRVNIKYCRWKGASNCRDCYGEPVSYSGTSPLKTCFQTR